ncbi:MAG TPA: 6,7-dimethyl-8-ribityllumazine synthase [Methylomirabilota bacterium]|jgi:6,7-dimethyl-8-ribityllumazine synthase|nr:6,7-dimethyl-8-ribityllumazine synthase [Methylomirabilota bacterium]
MVRIIRGKLDATGLRFGVVVSQFNSLVTERLQAGALDALFRHGAREEDLEVVLVPGAFDIPLFAKKMAASGRFDALICLGAVIRGDTPHFDYVSAAMTQGIREVMMMHGLPVTFGVLTTDTVEQALDRAGAKAGNKGFDAALTAIEMVNTLKALEERKS